MIQPSVRAFFDETSRSSGDVSHVQNGTKHIYIWGWVEYDDVFPRAPRHRTEFCVKLRVVADIEAGEADAIIWDHYKRFNNADDECEHKPKPYPPPIPV